MVRMPRVLIAASVAGMIAGVYVISSTMMKTSPTHPSSGIGGQLNQRSSVADMSIPEKTAVHLYFVDKGRSYLVAEERVLDQSDDPARFGKTILDALIEGPEQELAPSLPKTAALNAFYVTPAGVAYVDLAESASTMHPGGGETELLTIYSIVNSLVLNVSAIKMVKVLIDGRESDTLAGHIDLRFPFKANMLMVR
jgi:spore germination protein GerM